MAKSLQRPISSAGRGLSTNSPQTGTFPGRVTGRMALPSTRRSRIINELEKQGTNHLAAVVLGDCWSILVLNAISQGLHNFASIEKALRISSNVLSVRLRTLTSLGLLSGSQSAKDRRRYHYQLTDAGRDVYPMILTLTTWGDRWYAGAAGPQGICYHKTCGEILNLNVQCTHCGSTVEIGDVSRQPPAASVEEID